MTNLRKIDGVLYEKLNDIQRAEIGDIAVYADNPSIKITKTDASGELRGACNWLVFGVEYPIEVWREVSKEDSAKITPEVKFPKGTLVRVAEGSPYIITDDEMELAVVVTESDRDLPKLDIKVLASSENPDEEGSTFNVSSDYLIKVSTEELYEMLDDGLKYVTNTSGERGHIKSGEKVEVIEIHEEVAGDDLDPKFVFAYSDSGEFDWFGLTDFDEVKEEDTSGLDVGDLVRIKEEHSDEYLITNDEMLLGQIIYKTSTYIRVRVLIHENSRNIGKEYSVNPDKFERIDDVGKALGIDTGKQYIAKNDGEDANILEGELVDIESIELIHLTDGLDQYFIEAETVYGGASDWFRIQDLEEVREDEDLREGDLVRVKEEHANGYLITDERMLLGLVTELFGSHVGIQVISHKDKLLNGKTYTEKAANFKRVDLSAEKLGLELGKDYKTKFGGEFGDIGEGETVRISEICEEVLRNLDVNFILARTTTGRTDYFRVEDLEEVGSDGHTFGKGDIVYYDDPYWFETSGFGEVVYAKEHGARVRGIDGDGDTDTWFLDYDYFKLVAKASDRTDMDE